jgi:hypothetical protein
MDTENTNDDKAMPPASRGSHGDTLSVLRTLIDGVRGMGLGDPDCGDRIEASDVVRWAVDEIARLRLTDAEREAIWTVAEAYAENDGDPECERIASIMQGLWHRTN